MRLARDLLVFFAVLLTACLLVERVFSVHAPDAPVALAGVWKGGALVDRVVVSSASDPRVADLQRAHPDAEVVIESIDGTSPILTKPEALFALSLVPAHDGIEVTLGGQTAYVTPDDLLVRQAYDHGVTISELSISFGADVQVALALAADRLHATVPDIVSSARIRRIRVTRTRPSRPAAPRVGPRDVTPELVRSAALEAARYLARGVDERGRFRYLVDAASNRTLPGYDWPRHSGATYFLAQAAALSKDPDLTYATLRAASLLRDQTMTTCGANKCIGVDDQPEIGSSALATVAFAEIARTGLDASYRPVVADLARFLRSQQRPDGEFMHVYDRRNDHPVDVQYLYFSGEATLALARAQALDPGDLASRTAASRGLAFLVGPGWRFFGDRYYYGEEHWTCQALGDLWDVAPNPDALDFCVRWARYNRRLMHEDGDSPHDADGALGFDPVITPRLTPVASRCEAAVATLRVAKRAGASSGVPEAELHAMDEQLHRAFAFLLRFQFRAEGATPTHLFADPAAVSGAMPGSPVDWQLRIDYAQHAGSAMIRWLE